LQASGGNSYTWQPPTGLNNPNISNPVAILQNDITYTVQVSTAEGCTGSDSINVKVYANFEVFVPTAFSPNDDRLNDILRPLGKGIKMVKYFKVYNRYGQLVFESRDMNDGWNGTFKGKLQPMGVYVWMVGAIDIFGRLMNKNGTTVLIQ
jgi:gliding motility-associated-like protein